MATESKAAGLALVQIRSRPLSHPCEFDSLCSSLDVTIGRRPICSIGGTEQSDGSLSEADTDGCIAEDSGYSLTSTGGAFSRARRCRRCCIVHPPRQQELG